MASFEERKDHSMNKDQRKFLVDEIEKRARKDKEELRSRRPKEPSLNNYLVAAILDGSFKMKGSEEVRTAIRDRVRDMGRDQSLVDRSRSSFGRNDDVEGVDKITLPVDILFDLPPGYAEVYAKYEADLAAWQEEMKMLEVAFDAMRIKIQVGSNEALRALVDQADKLCELTLSQSSELLFKTGSPPALPPA